jgi:hypothetical protein
MSKMSEDIAVIKSEVFALSKTMDEFKTDTKGFIRASSDRIDVVEARSISTDQKVSNMSVFQSVFSVIIGAVATYLGWSRK